MKLAEVIAEGRERLVRAALQCADPLLHMKQIAEHCLALSTAEIYLRWEEPISEEGRKSIEAFVDRRITGEPFQYICGYEHFWDGRFEVGPGVLIPRRETELLVEALLSSETRSKVRVAELGAGSGNIGISVLRERRLWQWVGFELNPQSLPFLEVNRKSLLPAEAVYHIVAGDYFEKASASAPYDWIVSNAPYVTSGEMAGLAKEIHHEPTLALDGGPDGLDVIRRLIASAPDLLAAGGGIAGEMAAEQGTAVRRLLEDRGFQETRIMKDYAGLDRIFVGRWGKS